LLAKEREARLNNKNDELANVIKQIVSAFFSFSLFNFYLFALGLVGFRYEGIH